MQEPRRCFLAWIDAGCLKTRVRSDLFTFEELMLNAIEKILESIGSPVRRYDISGGRRFGFSCLRCSISRPLFRKCSAKCNAKKEIGKPAKEGRGGYQSRSR